MKRAFFKLGEVIELRTHTAESSFRLNLNVSKWRDEPRWEFKLEDVQDGKKQLKRDIGTTITITDLLPGVRKELELPDFPLDLLDEFTTRHRDAINRGFKLSVNSVRAQKTAFQLLASKSSQYQEYRHETVAPVRVKIACGIADNRPGTAKIEQSLSNGRMVLKSNQTPTTGWRSGSNVMIPATGQFSRFRGFVSFDSTDASRVPWKTTKAGLDEDSPIWEKGREKQDGVGNATGH